MIVVIMAPPTSPIPKAARRPRERRVGGGAASGVMGGGGRAVGEGGGPPRPSAARAAPPARGGPGAGRGRPASSVGEGAQPVEALDHGPAAVVGHLPVVPERPVDDGPLAVRSVRHSPAGATMCSRTNRQTDAKASQYVVSPVAW